MLEIRSKSGRICGEKSRVYLCVVQRAQLFRRQLPLMQSKMKTSACRSQLICVEECKQRKNGAKETYSNTAVTEDLNLKKYNTRNTWATSLNDLAAEPVPTWHRQKTSYLGSLN